jgi:hypothetical protein
LQVTPNTTAGVFMLRIFRSFVNEAFDAGVDTKDLATERHEFGVEPKTSVRKSGVGVEISA